MNPLRALLLVYHYAYYWMVEEQTHNWGDGKPAPKWSRSKAISVFVFVWIFVIGAGFLDYAIIEAMLGYPFHKSQMVPLPKTEIRSWLVALPFFLAIGYINGLLLNEAQVEYYRKIFHGWNKQKRMRWKIYVLLVAAIPFALVFAIGGIHQGLLQP